LAGTLKKQWRAQVIPNVQWAAPRDFFVLEEEFYFFVLNCNKYKKSSKAQRKTIAINVYSN
jgi:hypothetical protein